MPQLPPGSRGIIAGVTGGRRSRNQFFDRLVASRFRSKTEIGRLLRREEEARLDLLKNKPVDAYYYLTGVHKGVYYRIKLPSQEQSRLSRLALPRVPQIPSSPISIEPHAFKKIPASTAASSHHHGHHQQHPHQHAHPPTVVAASGARVVEGATGCSLNDFWWRLQEWWKENWTIVVLNVGSICSLFGFTRSDVLELRCFSMGGSLGAIVYNAFHKPSRRWAPILWSGTFAAVNGVKIVQILLERNSTVQMTDEQQSIYNQFFMPHGITPKQFERIYNKAEMIHIAKGDCLIRKGDRLEYVFLIVDGWTRANILGRHLTAGSFEPPAVNHKPGGSSGAWIGEIDFLENYWNKDQKDNKKRSSNSKEGKPAKLENNTGAATRSEQELTKTAAHMSNSDKNLSDKVEKHQQPSSLNAAETKPVKVNVEKRATGCLYTIVAKEDTTVLRWSHADMEQLMESSSDLRAGLTRAMTAAMAAKVIQFTLSRSHAFPTSWSAWLDDWKHTAPQRGVDPLNARGNRVGTIFSPKQDDDAPATLANDDSQQEEPLQAIWPTKN